MFIFRAISILGITWALSAHVSAVTDAESPSEIKQKIISQALKDGIDLNAFNFTSAALDEIVSWSFNNVSASASAPPKGASTVDVHSHHVPTWYRTIVPFTGPGFPTPQWSLTDHFAHMANESIERTVLSISTPSANGFLGNKNVTVALARLLNENSAALARAFPNRFNFMASIPLPYVNEAITEASYAINSLDAVGVALMSNHEGKYLGHPDFTGFFLAMQEMKAIVFVHPSDAELEINGEFIDANPTIYLAHLVEFFFETARTFMDLSLTQTLQNLTNVNFIIPHAGGSLPSIIDRGSLDASLDAFRTRCWWDSAGATYAHQIGGLLAYNISPSFLLFGSDFPYAANEDANLAAIGSSPFLTSAQKMAMKSENVKRLFAGKIQF